MKNDKPINIARYIQLLVKEPLDKSQTSAWMASVRGQAPSGTLATVQTTNEQGSLQSVCMVRNGHTATMNYIYLLREPRNNAIRYLGVTNNLKRRFRSHCHDGREGGPLFRKACWIRQLSRLDLKPIMQIIFSWNDKEISKNGRRTIERQWISDLRALGHDLTNTTKGGDGFDSEDVKKFNDLAGETERKRRAKKALNTLGAIGISSRLEKMIEKLGTVGLSLRAKRSIATQGITGLKERSRKGLTTLGVNGLKKRGDKISAAKQLKTAEERSNQMQKSHETRRMKIYGPSLPIGVCYFQRDKRFHAMIPKSESKMNKKCSLGLYKTLNDAIIAQEKYRYERIQDE